MKRPKIYIAVPVPKGVEDYISQFCDYEKWESKDQISDSEISAKLVDKEGLLIAGGIKVNRPLLDNAPNLRVISNISVGYNNFDLIAMKERKVIGTNTPYVLDDTVADLTFGLMISVARRISELDKLVKEGKWVSGDERTLFGTDVHHSTLGIIGMGRIGEVIAKRARFGFDMDVLYYNRSRKPDAEKRLGVKYERFDDLLKSSDFIVLTLPLTKDTYHLIDSKEFGLMKKTAIFINVSRGQTVNESALIEALENEKIAGAGLDVYETEPVDPKNPLLNFANVITVPHIGSATAKTRFNMAMTAARSLVDALSGNTPSTVVPELK